MMVNYGDSLKGQEKISKHRIEAAEGKDVPVG